MTERSTERYLQVDSFPHIWDEIMDAASYPTLLRLREVSSQLRDMIDARLFAHVRVTPARPLALDLISLPDDRVTIAFQRHKPPDRLPFRPVPTPSGNEAAHASIKRAVSLIKVLDVHVDDFGLEEVQRRSNRDEADEARYRRYCALEDTIAVLFRRAGLPVLRRWGCLNARPCTLQADWYVHNVLLTPLASNTLSDGTRRICIQPSGYRERIPILATPAASIPDLLDPECQPPPPPPARHLVHIAFAHDHARGLHCAEFDFQLGASPELVVVYNPLFAAPRPLRRGIEGSTQYGLLGPLYTGTSSLVQQGMHMTLVGLERVHPRYVGGGSCFMQPYCQELQTAWDEANPVIPGPCGQERRVDEPAARRYLDILQRNLANLYDADRTCAITTAEWRSRVRDRALSPALRDIPVPGLDDDRPFSESADGPHVYTRKGRITTGYTLFTVAPPPPSPLLDSCTRRHPRG